MQFPVLMRMALLLFIFLAQASYPALAIPLEDKISGSYILEWQGTRVGLYFFDQENSDYFYLDGRGQGRIPSKCIGRYTVEKETLKARILFCEDSGLQDTAFQIVFPKGTTFESLALPLTFQQENFDSIGALKRHQEDFKFHAKIIQKEGDSIVTTYSESSLKSLADIEPEALKKGTYNLDLALEHKEKYVFNGIDRFRWKYDTINLEKQGASGLSLDEIKKRLGGMAVQVSGQSANIKRKQRELIFGDQLYADLRKLMLDYDLSRGYVAPAVVKSVPLKNGVMADYVKCEGSVVIGPSGCTKSKMFLMSKNSREQGLPAINSCVRDLLPDIQNREPMTIGNYGIYNPESSHKEAAAIDLTTIKIGSHSFGFEHANNEVKQALEQFLQMRAPGKTVFTRNEIDELSIDFFQSYKRGSLKKLEIMDFWEPFFDCLSSRGISTSAWFNRDFYLIFKSLSIEGNQYSNIIEIDKYNKTITHFNHAHIFMYR